MHLYLQRNSADDPLRTWVLTRPDRSRFYFDVDGYQTATVDKTVTSCAHLRAQRRHQPQHRGAEYLTDTTGRRTLTFEYFATGDDHDVFAGNVKQTDVPNRPTADRQPAPGDHRHQRPADHLHLRLRRHAAAADRRRRDRVRSRSTLSTTRPPDHPTKLVRVDDPRGGGTHWPTNRSPPVTCSSGGVKTLTDRADKATGFTYTDPDGDSGSFVSSTVTDANGTPRST